MVVELGPFRAEARVVDDPAPVFERCRSGDLAAVGIDIPIGLLDTYPRDCDVEARRMLGARRSTVFPAPVRDVLDAVDHSDACRRSRAVSGKGLSIQAFNLIPAVAAIDRLLTADDRERIVEAHPECALARLAGRPMSESKHRPGGRSERRALLAAAHPGFERLLVSRPPDRSLPFVDLLDAAAVAVTAARVAAGTERRLGRQADRRGLTAQIVY